MGATRATVGAMSAVERLAPLVAGDPAEAAAALAALAHRAGIDDALRAAAVPAMDAFATTRELLERLGDLAASPAAAVRGAVLWAILIALA